MAHHKSAEKRIRQTIRKTRVNRIRLNQLRTSLRKVDEAILNEDHQQAKVFFNTAESLLARGTRQGILKRNAAARKTSRLATRIKKAAFQAT